MAAPKKYKLDLFGKLLPALDRRDFLFFNKLTDDEKKGFADIVALRAMSSAKTNDVSKLGYFIEATNVANKHLWNSALKDHPEFKYMTIAATGWGSRVNHEFLNRVMGKKRNTKVFDVLRRYYPTASNDELQMFIEINDVDGLIEIGLMLGLQKEPLREYKKEVKKVKK